MQLRHGTSLKRIMSQPMLEIGSDIVSGMTFTGNKYDGVSITMSLENFYIEVPQT